MPWDQFYNAGFTKIDICDRSTKDDLRLNVKEDMGSCGICAGAITGLGSFFCLCEGLRHIYFGHTTSEHTKSHRRPCCGCGCAGCAVCASAAVEPV